jgi:putative Holliday junction resolvase
MKYLGIDYGQKRLGLAVGDETHGFAFPLSVIENSENLVRDLVVVCKENNIDEIVVGESKNFNQEQNEIMKEVTPFVAKLEEASGLPVHLHPEFLTSMEAERLQGSNEMNDASAASLILKSFLDLKQNHGE